MKQLLLTSAVVVIGLSCSGDPAPLSESEIGNKAEEMLASPVVQDPLELYYAAMKANVLTDDLKWYDKAVFFRLEMVEEVERKTRDCSKEDRAKIVREIFRRSGHLGLGGYGDDKQADKREPEKGSTDDSKPKGSWPWWIYVASFIVACILYKCIEAWKYGTWDPRRREDRKRKIKKRGERAERRARAREKEVVKNIAEEGRLKKPLIADPIVEKAIRKELRKPTGELTKADLEKVTRLELRDNKLTDVKGLEKLTQLTELNLGRNQLTSVKGLENLTKLETLNLYKTQLMDPDVKSLMMLTKLTWLELGRNPDLTKAQIWLLKKALPKCDISSNPTK